MTSEPETPDPERLQRHVRALSAVNRQLRAQLEGGRARAIGETVASGDDLLANMGATDEHWSPIRVRRASVGSKWLKELQRQGGRGEPFLVHAPTRGVFVVEGGMRRAVVSGLLSTALTRTLGPVRGVADHALDAWSEGPPVAILEAGTGRPFVVVGGRRLPLRGLPLPHPVENDEMLAFPVGEELQLGVGVRGDGPVARARRLIAQEGPARGATALFRKIGRRVRRLGSGGK